MTLWGEPLARELARDLAGTHVVELIKIEPDLDPNVHHTNMPYAILSDRHTIAIVSGHNVMIDGPQLTNNSNRYVTTPTEIAANRELIRHAAVWGVSAPAEHGGVADTALSIMRFLKQHGRWCVSIHGNSAGGEAYLSARGGRHRWPAGMSVVSTSGGIKLTCGSSERVITSLSDLVDFASREAPILDAEVLWCQAHVATLAKLRPFGEAAFAVIKCAAPGRAWQLSIGDEYFTRDAKPVISIYFEDTREVAATVMVEGTGVKLAIGELAKTFASPAAISARVEELAAALKAWLASPAAEPPVRDMDYYR